MGTLNNAMFNRRQAIVLGLGGTAAFGLAACGGNASSGSASGGSDASSSGGSSSSGSTAEATQKVDAAAFDKLVAGGPKAEDAAIAQNKWASKVKDGGKLRVGAVDTSALFSQLDEKDGRHRGFDAGLFQLPAVRPEQVDVMPA